MTLPKNVTSYQDRIGCIRFRYRQTGYPQQAFCTNPGTIEFDEELAAFRANLPSPHRRGRARRPALAAEYALPICPFPIAAGSYVYFVGHRSRGSIKIGVSATLRDRIKRLRTGSPDDLHLLAWIAGDAHVEKHYHNSFRDIRLRGEWFERTPALLRCVAELAHLAQSELANLG